MQSLRIEIFGKVHGVFFRQSTFDLATSLDLKGTVQNLPGGSVEIIAEGTQDKLNILIDWCKNGPANAKVGTIKVSPAEIKNYQTFKII